MNFKKRIKINFDKQEFVSNIVINLILLNFLAGDFYVKKPRHMYLERDFSIISFSSLDKLVSMISRAIKYHWLYH